MSTAATRQCGGSAGERHTDHANQHRGSLGIGNQKGAIERPQKTSAARCWYESQAPGQRRGVTDPADTSCARPAASHSDASVAVRSPVLALYSRAPHDGAARTSVFAEYTGHEQRGVAGQRQHHAAAR
jgi:hypothetical protein